MILRIRKLVEEAVIPSYATYGDAGMDLTAVSRKIEDNYIEYGIGLAIEIPIGHVGLIFPRSSVSNKKLVLCNSVGVIDSGYRGEIKCRFKYIAEVGNDAAIAPNEIYHISDKVAQMVIIPYPHIQLEEVDELEDSERSDGGFGSSGK